MFATLIKNSLKEWKGKEWKEKGGETDGFGSLLIEKDEGILKEENTFKHWLGVTLN